MYSGIFLFILPDVPFIIEELVVNEKKCVYFVFLFVCLIHNNFKVKFWHFINLIIFIFILHFLVSLWVFCFFFSPLLSF